MKERKFVIGVFAVVLAVASLNVVSIINGMNDSSYESYAMGTECSAQGAMVAQPFNELIVSPEVPNENQEYFSSSDMGSCPPSWDSGVKTASSSK